MKVIRKFEGYRSISDNLSKELEQIVPRYKIIGTNWRGKEKKIYNWTACWNGDLDLYVFLEHAKYEKEFIKICKKYDVDKLFVEY